MTDRFIDNFTPGDGTDGLTWAKAELTAAAVDAADAAGDRWLFDYRHSETTAATVTITVAGTPASPSQLLSVTQSGASGVSALTAGAVIEVTGNGSVLNINGSLYAYGLTLKAGASTNATHIQLIASNASTIQCYDSCTFQFASTATTPRIIIGTGVTGSAGCEVVWTDCVANFAHASQGIQVQGSFEWRGGSLAGTAVSTLFASIGIGSGRSGFAKVTADLSGLATGAALVNAAAMYGGSRARFRNCKLPASWSGTLVTGSFNGPGQRVEMQNCSAGDVNYALWVEDYAGSIKHETTLVKTGGASDGTTPISWKMATSANAEYPTIVLRSPEIAKWNETTGSSVTVTVDFLHDSATNLQDDEIWLEVEYLGTSGFPLAVFTDDAAADVVATPADQTTSAATWTTTGMSNPNEQKLSVTFTPQEKGLIIARVCMGIASKTVYVDPELQIS